MNQDDEDEYIEIPEEVESAVARIAAALYVRTPRDAHELLCHYRSKWMDAAVSAEQKRVRDMGDEENRRRGEYGRWSAVFETQDGLDIQVDLREILGRDHDYPHVIDRAILPEPQTLTATPIRDFDPIERRSYVRTFRQTRLGLPIYKEAKKSEGSPSVSASLPKSESASVPSEGSKRP